MSRLDMTQNVVQDLCDLLQAQALEPAHKQAQELVEAAKQQACQILEQAHQQAQALLLQTKEQISKERLAADSALQHAARMTLQDLRRDLEERLFNEKIKQLAHSTLQEPQLIAEMLRAYIGLVSEQGISSDFSAFVGRSYQLQELKEQLAAGALEKLREGQLLQILPQAGLKIQLHDAQISIEATDEALQEILSQHLLQDLRERFFKKG